MAQSLVPFFLFLIPAFYAGCVSVDLFRRNARKLDYLLAAILTGCIALLFVSEFLKSQLPPAYTIPIALYGSYFFTFLCGSLSLHFFIRISGVAYKYVHKASILCYVPLAIYAALLLSGDGERLFRRTEVHGIWRQEIPALSFYGLLGLLLLMSCSTLTIAWLGIKRAGNDHRQKRFKLLYHGIFAYMTTFILFAVLIKALRPIVFIPDSISELSVLIFTIYIHLLMVRYDFLPTEQLKYKKLFQISQSAILLFDEKANILEANPQAYKLLDWDSSRTLVGQNYIQFIPETRQPYFLDTFRSGFSNNRVIDFEYAIRTFTGATKNVLIDTDSIRHGDETIVMAVVRDITQKKQEELLIRHMAHHDLLTGLPNRLSFQRRTEELIRAKDENSAVFGVILIDLDRFKQVNDTWGHEVGDGVLIESGRRMKEALREIDCVFRLGGDEFVALIMGDRACTIDAARALLRAVEDELDIDTIRIAIGGSLGISLYPAHGQDVSSLLRTADHAMYKAKKKRGHGFEVYGDSG
ncbi:sensor domain-containing diguanylate cyclase [Cohnella sp. 56]|uniref:sensor domain-containing diguanylate cyclase n=1 Tax=Cohnella sp. 56 TaxID=3113722 RepID=UPI0030EA9EE7